MSKTLLQSKKKKCYKLWLVLLQSDLLQSVSRIAKCEKKLLKSVAGNKKYNSYNKMKRNSFDIELQK